MNFLKYKLATLGKSGQQERLDWSNPLNNSPEPEKLGLLPSKEDYDFATPNLDRKEDVTLISSNTMDKNSLVLNLKWRPNKEAQVATLLKDFKLLINGISYSYHQVETYRPQESPVRPGRFLQYGSARSSLKFIVSSPYRRLRLLFRGHMKKEGTNDSVFVKLNFIIHTSSASYDFYDQYDPEYFKQICLDEANRPFKIGFKEALNDLLLHDRHEHAVRVAGDCFVQDEQPFKDLSFTWGFYVREFSIDSNLNRKTTRLLAHISNGQLFHLAQNQIGDDKLQFGYTCFSIMPYLQAIDKQFEIEPSFEELEKGTDEFKTKVYGEGRFFEASGKKRVNHLPGFYDIEFNDKQGWAYFTINDPNNIENKEVMKQLEASELEYLKKVQDGQIIEVSKKSNDSETNRIILTNTDESDCLNSDLVGAKAASLAQLKKFNASNYNVPHAFVLTRYAHDELLKQYSFIEDKLAFMQKRVVEGQLGEELKEECKQLESSVADSKLPDCLFEVIRDKISTFYGEKFDELKFAVRSSSWGEDEEGMSAAGQLTTILSVKGVEDISKAVMKCFASKFSYENIEYKRQHGLPLNLPMAVVIQEMVQCEKAGVMFTCEPTNGDPSLILITANYGLGESVVSGQTEPDSMKVRIQSDGKLSLEDTKIGSKVVVVDEDTLGGSSSSKQYDKSKCCLSEEEALKLAECGMKVSHYYQAHLDIEWGFKNSELFLLQARPITGLENFTDFELLHEADQATRAENNFVTRANIGEVMSGALKPLTLTFFLYAWSIEGCRIQSRFGSGKIKKFCITCSQEVMYDSYHTFFGLRCSVLFLIESSAGDEVDPARELLSQSMQVSFFGHPIEDVKTIAEASKGIIPAENFMLGRKYELYTLMLRYRPIPTILKQKNVLYWLEQQVEKLSLAKGYQENKMLGLYNQMKDVTNYNHTAWTNHIVIMRVGGQYNLELSMFLAQYIKDSKRLYSTCSRFFATSKDVLSAEIPQRIRTMSELLKSKPKEELDDFVNKLSVNECVEYLTNNKDEKLANQYKGFIKLFGYRSYNEFELSQDTWATDPSKIIEMLRKNCMSEPAEVKKTETVEEIIKSIEADCGIEIQQAHKEFLSNVLVPRVQTMIRARELTKDILVQYTDIIRRATRLLMKEMVANLRIPDENLFYYLFYDEIEPLIREPQPSIVLQALRRRQLFKQFEKPWLFDEIITGYNFVPNHLKPTRELEEKLAKAPRLHGTPASSGRVEGRICLVDGYHELDKVRSGDILLTHSTDIAFSPIFPLIRGIITEVGGLISHGAVVAREYGLPSVLGIPDVCRIIQDGEQVVLDADNGVIIRLGLEASTE